MFWHDAIADDARASRAYQLKAGVVYTIVAIGLLWLVSYARPVREV